MREKFGGIGDGGSASLKGYGWIETENGFVGDAGSVLIEGLAG